ncbi:hypothetical protein A3E66_04710 [Candidatus Daviesbacteria bacterium RIFCSPHIGHO2_12_FULL_37_16]|uniref:Toxin YoeB n=3 Tax=Candidatus Daviesiibacteriota TaxID=1752718 RepID=A0A0G0EPH3_9BACT|nr:MAG: hypothetical protein US19_C0018G0020 [Candidatus Daviesbacteria bacterium GW2011_GWB1_36_5]KKQ14171.1 MAG: hypothetical protein US28_C0038G0007 [Candidatus Daviesbacteria bacterium GW2011_GWA1_36_8]OGE31551.1 MAG: hypothetical protein A3C99_02250 [Candidatus Daviesbacteria bacterium RIFCSPHIGHO2_02_FULL_37_9]OGE34880.1 MAG: hypothetical protein A3E66_04710 [Candidatus Daviesbacteria bacterium RIFCSPHIGHO2_12_FULL_37_16]
MNLDPLRPKTVKYLQNHNLTTKFEKQVELLLRDFRHPGLHNELLEPKEFGVRSFRINRSYRALFIYDQDMDTIRIVKITKHYQ